MQATICVEGRRHRKWRLTYTRAHCEFVRKARASFTLRLATRTRDEGRPGFFHLALASPPPQRSAARVCRVWGLARGGPRTPKHNQNYSVSPKCRGRSLAKGWESAETAAVEGGGLEGNGDGIPPLPPLPPKTFFTLSNTPKVGGYISTHHMHLWRPTGNPCFEKP